MLFLIIVIDIGSGECVVLCDGLLMMVMWVSMLVFGLLVLVIYDGCKLVDGGLVDNVLIGEVWECCKVDVVIVVNVGLLLFKVEEVGLLLIVLI